MTREESKKYIKSKMCNGCSIYLGGGKCLDNCSVIEAIKALEPEPLTDEEQRIFLAAMEREEKICREADEKFPYKMPYEESMVSVCRSIKKKVKKTLWE